MADAACSQSPRLTYEGPLSLSDALLAWCDPGLVSAYQATNSEGLPPAPARPGGWLRGRAEAVGDLRQEAFREHRAKLRATIEAQRERCWAALLADFRSRVGSGEIRLTGLQLSPTLARARTDLPPVWAVRMKLLLRKGQVLIGDAVFADVTAERVQDAKAPVPAQVGAVEPLTEFSIADEEPPPPRRKPGRKPTDDVVREALLARWDRVATEAAKAPSGRPNMLALAHALRKDMQRRYAKQPENKLPHVGTIRKNLPTIYDDLVREIGCGKSKPAQ